MSFSIGKVSLTEQKLFKMRAQQTIDVFSMKLQSFRRFSGSFGHCFMVNTSLCQSLCPFDTNSFPLLDTLVYSISERENLFGGICTQTALLDQSTEKLQSKRIQHRL